MDTQEGIEMRAWPGIRARLLEKRQAIVGRWQSDVLGGRMSWASTDRMWRLTCAIDLAIEALEIDAGLRAFEVAHA